ncbi:hypothetical protein [Cellulomonas aerilata]|uniref:Uncharacterized protein n=1 Tax=Cellulomonas aerilata TaxID=515326 RepID=A0A512DD44_9CELL|nr:hypothetical protein [Cellulomonas aerilata]GEO34357.1 hypothetical protein CAE01nite_20820 [Cellulomonas aerilata]
MDDLTNAPRDVEEDDAQVAPDGDLARDQPPAAPGEGPSAALVEVLPGVVIAFGDVPAGLGLDLVDFGFVPAADRKQLATALGSLIGNTATVGGNIANAVSSTQGLYQVSSATQALLNNGAVLAVKDGANLGSVWMNGDLVAQARFIPVSAASAASVAAAIGPAVAMVAIQMQLNEITGLVRTNIALTTQVLGALRSEQWAELSGHVAAIDRALAQAREIESIPKSLWETIAGDEAALRKQVDLYRRHVGGHLRGIDQPNTRARREYLDANAEAIVFDSHALMSSLKAWTGYKALQAGRARSAGDGDAYEARLVDVIIRDTRTELEAALADATQLVDAVTRELRLVAEPAGPMTIPLTRKRRDHRAARVTSNDLLRAIEPLADALRPTPPPVSAPTIVCSFEDVDLDPYLRVLRWTIDADETLRCIAFCYDRDELDVVALGQNVLSRIEPEKWATLVAVTDRRVITSRASEFRREGRIGRQIPLDDVRYVRARSALGADRRPEVDLISREVDFRWGFHADTDPSQVAALAAVLADSMMLPDAERKALIQTPGGQIEAGGTPEGRAARTTDGE